MDFHLVREMEALGPDAVLRRRNILNLLSFLNQHELGVISRAVADVDFRTDILARLPPELHLCIAKHVDKRDVISFLNVSKTWRAIWSEDSMIRIMMPALWEYHRQKDKTASSVQNLQVLFYNASRRHRIFSRGKYRSVLNEGYSGGWWDPQMRWDTDHEDHIGGKFPWWETPETEDFPEFRNFLYHDGRAVWQPRVPQHNDGFILVDDLKKQLRKVFTIPGAVMLGGEPELLAVGDKLVVARLDRTLHAWDLETNHHCSVTLPSPTFRYNTYGHQVYTYSSLLSKKGSVPELEMYVWEFQQHIRELDSRPLLEAIGQPSGDSVHWYCVGIIPHPLLDDTMFVVCKLGCHVVSVHKYTGGVYCSSQSFTTPEKICPFDPKGFSGRLSPMNSYGHFAVAAIDLPFSNPTVQVVCFDALREVFSMEEYTTNLKSIMDTVDCTWRDSQVVYVRERFLGGKAYLTVADETGPIDVLGPNSLDRYSSKKWLWADDNFIVLRGYCGYIVLSTDTDFKKSR